MKNRKSSPSRPAAVYTVLSLDQLRALVALAELKAGPDAPSHRTVSLRAEVCGPAWDDNGAAQLASYSVEIEGANVNRFLYCGKTS